MADTDLIKVYRSKPVPDEFFSVAFIERRFLDYPYTTVEVPDELKDKVIRFDWINKKWIDITTDAMLGQINALQKQNATLALKLAEAEKTNTLSQQERDALKSAIASLGLQLAAALKQSGTEEVAK